MIKTLNQFLKAVWLETFPFQEIVGAILESGHEGLMLAASLHSLNSVSRLKHV